MHSLVDPLTGVDWPRAHRWLGVVEDLRQVELEDLIVHAALDEELEPLLDRLELDADTAAVFGPL